MSRTFAQDPSAATALELVRDLQARLVAALESCAAELGVESRFRSVEWLRDEGRHGGGRRYQAPEGPVFDRASVNVSQVHYDDLPDKRLASATALSAIVHPAHPSAPSMHIHVSWTHMRDGQGYWRVMGDLNPSHPIDEDTTRFEGKLRAAAGESYEGGMAQGARYFWIPALERTRGVAHYYLEAYRTEDRAADLALARRMGEAIIDVYAELLERRLSLATADDEARARQREYHTLYLFQVLSLDRGTTSGLLVHDQNDIGIMGSLPSQVDAALLQSWAAKVPAPQDELVQGLVEALCPGRTPGLAQVDAEAKQRLAQVVRQHYRTHPEALALQAAGDVVPPTVANHATVGD